MRVLVCTKAGMQWGLNVYKELQEDTKHNFKLVTVPDALQDEVQKFDPELIVFLHWSWLIPSDVLKYRCISTHTAPLPRYRGGSPIQNQILAGETESAVTLFYTSEALDAGEIILQETISLEGDLKDIFERVEKASIKMVKGFLGGKTDSRPQEGTPTYCERRTPEQGRIDPSKSAAYNYNLVRALNMPPYPPAFIECDDGKRLYVLKATLEE
ncbi:MAG: formyltransferase family protein [bacterium]